LDEVVLLGWTSEILIDVDTPSTELLCFEVSLTDDLTLVVAVSSIRVEAVFSVVLASLD